MKLSLPVTAFVAMIALAADSPDAAQRMPDRGTALRAAADALGMVRWSDIGNGATVLPGIDVINTMEFTGTARVEDADEAFTAGYHVALGYNPPALRVEITRTGTGAGNPPRHAIQTVRENFAWDESEIGAGLVPGHGIATPAPAALKARLLQLWTLPYGVVKAALAAGTKTTVSTDSGATVVTFPLSGQLAGITVKATLDANNFVMKVETRPDDPALVSLAAEVEYFNYADRGEVPTDIKSPGRIIRRQRGRTVLELDVETWEANNPYLVFPVPPNVKTAK